jgi:hypothetical protein
MIKTGMRSINVPMDLQISSSLHIDRHSAAVSMFIIRVTAFRCEAGTI